MTRMNNLVQLTLAAHGGLERWRRFEHVSARQRTGGVLWEIKRQRGVIDDVSVRVALRREWASHCPFGEATWRTSFEPRRVAIETADRQLVEERLSPRDSFAGHTQTTPWDRIQLAYFAGYAMWTYLLTPFLFTLDGVATRELEPWRESGESWRRLEATFAPEIATHSTVQTFYFGPDGLLRRQDYDPDVLGGSPAAHYVEAYEEFSGMMVATKRRVLERRSDGTSARDTVLVSIDLSDVRFT